ncbi:MAG: lysophospholipid acyltransferase family protein [Anaerolineae bacterium]|nr:lysophospholipid acyltransferase family protein [Anaerolineae bacterium]
MKLLRILVNLLIFRPLIMIVLGLNINGQKNLPLRGPAVVAANHNSHLDTLTLLSLWPLETLHHVRPVAAADSFLTNPLLAWFTLNIMRIIPIDRRHSSRDSDPLAEMSAALAENEILILYPEGSRGSPEQLSKFKSGVSRLAERHPEVPIIPVFMYGLGKSLPRGTMLLVPFFCDVLIGDPIYWRGSVQATMDAYRTAMLELASHIEAPEWE